MIYAYTRVSTDEQGESGLGLAAQAASFNAWLAGREGELLEEVASGGGGSKRPVLQALWEGLQEGDTVYVAQLDRLTRDLEEYLRLISLFRKLGVELVIGGMPVDLDNPDSVIGTLYVMVGAYGERLRASWRTGRAMKARKAQNPDAFRKPHRALSPETLAEIRELREGGLTYREIAEQLEKAGVPTAQGGKWRPGTISYLIRKAA